MNPSHFSEQRLQVENLLLHLLKRERRENSRVRSVRHIIHGCTPFLARRIARVRNIHPIFIIFFAGLAPRYAFFLTCAPLVLDKGITPFPYRKQLNEPLAPLVVGDTVATHRLRC